ncbi:hypothetical protein LINPERPRIM_LOCUS31544 [Linum perenne]
MDIRFGRSSSSDPAIGKSSSNTATERLTGQPISSPTWAIVFPLVPIPLSLGRRIFVVSALAIVLGCPTPELFHIN